MYNKVPEAKYVISERTLREMRLPDNVLSAKRPLLRWIALALGLYSEGEKRNTVIDVLDALFHYHFSRETPPSAREILDFVNKRKVERGEEKVNEETVRYHLRKMISFGILERKGGKYFLKSGYYSDVNDPARFVHSYFDRLEDIKKVIERAARQLPSFYTKTL